MNIVINAAPILRFLKILYNDNPGHSLFFKLPSIHFNVITPATLADVAFQHILLLSEN